MRDDGGRKAAIIKAAFRSDRELFSSRLGATARGRAARESRDCPRNEVPIIPPPEPRRP
jgi:hypothetical protein